MLHLGIILERTRNDPNSILLFEDHAEIILYNKDRKEVCRTKIDLEDVKRASNFKWHLSTLNYVKSCKNKKHKDALLHRLVMKAKKGEEVDHINRNVLDNRKFNLRRCSRQQNCCNRKIQTNNTSGVRGVVWNKKSEKWRAQISYFSKMKALGDFSKKGDAEAAYKEASKRLYKNFSPEI